MNNSVVIKGNKYGIVIQMDKNVAFSDLKTDLIEKFKSASKFFDKANMAVSFEGAIFRGKPLVVIWRKWRSRQRCAVRVSFIEF